ncbi:MAG: YgiQ family radical SAM protein [Salinivirgaceae bacterium]|nr:YgiQ family radical SAM protein [Salinivirgaceae bacterium]
MQQTVNLYANHKITDWLPTSVKEMAARGWDQPDVVLFSGDAYVDHPSFGAAVIGRVLESQGLKVVIVPQPNWRDDLRDFRKFGRPRMFFGVSAGAMDSMVNHYTANKRRRSDDAYTAGGIAGQRPDYASVVYCNILKELYPDVPIVLGGIEASLRRFVHYDYWSDSLKPSILVDTKADILSYGMGEKTLIELATRFKRGDTIEQMSDLPQIGYLRPAADFQTIKTDTDIVLSSYEKSLKDKIAYAVDFKTIEEESNKWHARRILQLMGDKLLIVNPQYEPWTQAEVDFSFDLPYTRLPHPRYKDKTIPAYEMIRHSVNLHRGCFGGCSFCTISAHQGKFVVSRSEESILKEIEKVTQMPDFKGYLSDLGGPSANMYNLHGKDTTICERCKRPSCIFPNICKNLNTNHEPLTKLYQKVAANPKIKKAFIGSGVRYDLLLNYDHPTPDKLEYIRQLIVNHVSGRLKVAPEHTSDAVLQMMRKPPFALFKQFNKIFQTENQCAGLNQQLIPYFISSHPASTKRDMAQLMLETKKLDFKLEQVQDFTPTPMTLSTTIYYSGIDPYTMKPVYTARTKDEKLEQRKFFFWYKPEFRRQIDAELRQMGLSADLGGSAKGGSFNPNFKQNVGWKNPRHPSANGENKSKNTKEKKSNFKSRRK